MKNLFVPYDIARQLEGKGFNEPCLAKYEREDYMMEEIEMTLNSELQNEELFEADAPLFQQVIDWFREKHNVIISVVNRDGKFLGCREYFIRGAWRSNYTDRLPYYEALSEAIKQALKLI